ncbi:uncharacterized protein [Diadema setosum]|uniref:uncharacterized protein n=1 Tax=Diadema setosum TaxID=31175 RepID=UPI003B3B58F7
MIGANHPHPQQSDAAESPSLSTAHFALAFDGNRNHRDQMRLVSRLSNHESPCDETSVEFRNLLHGYQYRFQVATYNSTSKKGSIRDAEIGATTPDCYEETQDRIYCASRSVQTIGISLDLRVESVTKFWNKKGVTARVAWHRPIQINGTLSIFMIALYTSDAPSSLSFSEVLSVDPEDADVDGGDVTFIRDIGGLEEEETYIMSVKACVQQGERTISIPGPPIMITFMAIVTSHVTTPAPPTTTKAQIGFAPGFELVRTRRPRILPVIDDGQVTTNATTTAVTTPNIESNDQTTPSSATSSPFSENSATTPLPVSESLLSEWTKVLLYSGIPAFVLACLVVFLVVSLRRRRAEASDKTQFIRYPDEGSADRSPSPKVKRPIEEYQPKDPAFQGKEFDRSLLKIEKELGAGQFGIVYKAFAFGITGLKEYVSVAAKSLRVNATSAMKEDFLNEIRLMIDLGPHPNILPILGCCTTEEPYYLITEYMKYGDLLHFLWKCREDKYRQKDNTFDLTSANQLQIARQIARGMEYIFKARYYHGDLAARNVLVGEGLEVKISDFGLADDIYQSGYKRLAPDRKRPVKWVSLETNTIGQCTIQSDVWSFGIVLYEIYTLGGIPYSGMDGREVVHRTQEGYRMEKPDHCTDQIYEVMRACWHANPAERPTFTTIFKRLDEMLAIDSDYLTAEDDLCKSSRSTAPSYGELVRRSSAEDMNPADASNEKEADGQSEEVDISMATASMETGMGHGIHGPPLAEEECSFEIKRDDEILLDPARLSYSVNFRA